MSGFDVLRQINGIMTMMTMGDADNILLTAYAANESEAAFRAIVERHVDLVFATAFRLTGDRGMAEEISQNVFFALARKAPRLTGYDTLAGWLHRTTVLESRAKVRAELRRRRRETAAADISFQDREGSSPLAGLIPLLDEGLMGMRENDRTALILRFFEERSYREVGLSIGLDEEAARKRVARALHRLGDFFRQRGFTMPAATGVQAVLAEGRQAAPPSLATAAAGAALTTKPAVGGSILSYFRNLCSGKAKVAAVCLLLPAVPLAWQWVANREASGTWTRLNTELSKLQERKNALALEQTVLEESLKQAAESESEARVRFYRAEAVRAGRLPPPRYAWDDGSPLARIPKSTLAALDISAVAGDKARLSSMMTEALQLTLPEAGKIQTALDKFLAEYRAAEKVALRPVPPVAEDLLGHLPSDSRVFEVDDLHAKIDGPRAVLFTDLRTVLAPDRFELLLRGLRFWMPVDDQEQGFNSGMVIIPDPHRIVIYAPSANSKVLGWGVRIPGRGMFSTQKEPNAIPESLRATVSDWITLAENARMAAPAQE